MICEISYLSVPISIPIIGCRCTTATVHPKQFGLIMPGLAALFLNPILLKPIIALWPYLQLLLRKKLWKPSFGNNRPFPPIGIYTGQTQPEKAKVWISTAQHSDSTGHDIWALILLSFMIGRDLVIAKRVTAPERTRRLHMQQQQPKYIHSSRSCKLS